MNKLTMFLLGLFLFCNQMTITMENPDKEEEIDTDNLLKLWINYDNAVNELKKGKISSARSLCNSIKEYTPQPSQINNYTALLRAAGHLFNDNKDLKPEFVRVEGKKISVNHKDYAQDFFRKAADQYNDLFSLYLMAYFEFEKENYKASREYLFKYLNHEQAREPYKSTIYYILGEIYYEGKGVERDLSKALEYYEQVKSGENIKLNFSTQVSSPDMSFINKNNSKKSNNKTAKNYSELERDIFYHHGRIKNNMQSLYAAAILGHQIACKEYLENTELEDAKLDNDFSIIKDKNLLLNIVLNRFVPATPDKKFPEQWQFLEKSIIAYSEKGYLSFVNLYVKHHFSYDSIFPENSFPSSIVDYLDSFYKKQIPLKDFEIGEVVLSAKESDPEITNMLISVEKIIENKNSPGFKLFYIRFISALLEGFSIEDRDEEISEYMPYYKRALEYLESIHNESYLALTDFRTRIYKNASLFLQRAGDIDTAMMYAKKAKDCNPSDLTAQFCYATSVIARISQNKKKKERLSEMFEILYSLIDKGFGPAGGYMLSVLIGANQLADAKTLYYKRVLPKLSDEGKKEFEEYRELFKSIKK